MTSEPLPRGWHRIGKNLILALRNRTDGGTKEYHAELYRVEPGGTLLEDLVEVYCYNATHLGMTLEIDGMEHRYLLSVGLPFWTFGLRGGRPRQRSSSREREYGWKFHNGTLWLLGGRSPDESSRDDPWWWEKTVNLKRLIFGRTRYTRESIEVGTALIQMPEGPYYATVELYEARWDSPRPLLGRFVRQRVRSAEVELHEAIPIPGKGENSYDLDDDAIYSVSLAANTMEEAAAAVREDALSSRERYGGSVLWQPQEAQE
jgi:hypothetical protein